MSNFLKSSLFICILSPLPLPLPLPSFPLSQLSKLLLIFTYVRDLLCGGGGLVETQLDPLVDELLGQFEPDDALAEAQYLCVVTQHAPLHAVRVVRRHCPDALDFVRRDGDTQPRAADKECAVGLESEH